ncbi:pyruvate carboxylase [Subsaximicrobium wynnwilliamsii]|uniref:Pyruvate carboxylase n=1 Tax=Subsaximicrobium wynnwilliamsii TaxID=291179 RepID=A0A5C6ZMA5_9FLAO|nr:pyruvate carboxylase [Subsaximicrobium wynnwilliamsii]TXD84382.1 pyruvate carboxylase [Subsaximicrobium wynnwilliamsii]TXD90063.1 pyruvate carboxylase [Subsaximicrobium wynnwilliamsii]TXE04115.1 pyruvate carboxylase [Subsaximicrobium wynnwilliamsii]
MKIKKVLIANRGEIAIRVLRACTELNLKTVAVYTYEDRYSQHRNKADESYQIGENDQPLRPYLNIDLLIRLAKSKGVDAIHPGYGFLSENSEFARQCAANGIIFIGPEPEVMDALGDKITAKKVAVKCHVPIIESNKKKLSSLKIAIAEAKSIGYPLMLKAASGGGGRGMRIIKKEEDLENNFDSARNEAANAFGDDTMFLEKYVENPKHIEVQIVADNYGNIRHLHERDCSVQRRHQKVVEIAPSHNVSDKVKQDLYKYAVDIAKQVNYNNIGTVEFLVDKEDQIYFIEVNPRIQVEHTVTEMVTGIDLVKTQIFVAGGYKLDSKQIKIYGQDSISTYGFALQCRLTTEDPANNFTPDYGSVTTYRSASGMGIRLDAGSIYQGYNISPFFDSLLVKVSSHGRTLDGATRKMVRALKEFRIRGVKTNIHFLQNVIQHPTFKDGKATVNFIQNTPSLFKIDLPQDRTSKVVNFLAEVIVNGNSDVKNIEENKVFRNPKIPKFDSEATHPKGSKDMLTEMGPEKFCQWLMAEKKIHFTDTTMRDAHQSLLATRMRTFDMMKVAESYAKNHPQIFSMEVWGGATFDVCMRFLYESPWTRLRQLRQAMPNVLFQMLLRGSNAVGYKAYPDNLIEKFVEKSWENGVDVFRIFDSLNWVKAMEPSINYVRNKTGGIAEAALSYTGDILDVKETKYTLAYYTQLAKDLENAGAHMIAIKDMAGLLKPYAATELVAALKDTVKLPIHLHTHDTSSLQSATYLKAIEAGVDVVDVALGGLSGLTSQPNFNAIVEMMKNQPRAHDFDMVKLNEFSNFWEDTRELYYPFESGLKAGTAEVFQHEIPGGQYSNLRPQAIALGIGDRFDEVKRMYAAVNTLFGNLIKVTPSSKVVGDMAIFMVTNNLTTDDVMQRGEEISFPESVISFFMGDLGQPTGGFPKKLQKIILKNRKPFTNRPNAHLEPIDFDGEFEAFKKKFQKGFTRTMEMEDFLSYTLYPKVYEKAHENYKKYGNLTLVPTENFFYGMKLREEILIDLEPGKTVIIKLLSVGIPNDTGVRTVFFKVNGENRFVEVLDTSLNIKVEQNTKTDPENTNHVGAPLQGSLYKILVKKGQAIKENDPLFVIEAMKMETTVTAFKSGKVKAVALKEGAMVKQDDLVITME